MPVPLVRSPLTPPNPSSAPRPIHLSLPHPPLSPSPTSPQFRNFFGAESVGVSEGTTWKTGRKAIGKSLRPTYIRTLFRQVESCANDALDLLSTMVDEASCPPSVAAAASARVQAGRGALSSTSSSGIVDVAPLFHATALDMVCEAIFCERLGAIEGMREGKPDTLVEAFRFAEDEMARRTSSMNPVDWLYWSWLGWFGGWGGIVPGGEAQRRLDEAKEEIRKAVAAVVARRTGRGFEAKENDLLRHMVGTEAERGRKGEKLSREGVVDNVVTMMWAGHDTTAAALSFAVHLLAQNEDVQDRLRAEMVALGGGLESGERILAAPYLNAVVLEILRLHPPTLWSNRGLTEDVVLGDENPEDAEDAERPTVRIPAGTGVFIPIWAVHRSPLNWPDRPNEFVPERFLPAERSGGGGERGEEGGQGGQEEAGGTDGGKTGDDGEVGEVGGEKNGDRGGGATRVKRSAGTHHPYVEENGRER